MRFLRLANRLRNDGGVSMAKGLYILVGVLPSRHLERVFGVLGVIGDSSNLKRRLVDGLSFWNDKQRCYNVGLQRSAVLTCAPVWPPSARFSVYSSTWTPCWRRVWACRASWPSCRRPPATPASCSSGRPPWDCLWPTTVWSTRTDTRRRTGRASAAARRTRWARRARNTRRCQRSSTSDASCPLTTEHYRTTYLNGWCGRHAAKQKTKKRNCAARSKKNVAFHNTRSPRHVRRTKNRWALGPGRRGKRPLKFEKNDTHTRTVRGRAGKERFGRTAAVWPRERRENTAANRTSISLRPPPAAQRIYVLIGTFFYS